METKNKSKTEMVSSQEETHKGTIVSVTVVGLVILVTYLVLYGLYMARI
ncbi:cytochrome c oxidase subunit 2A [Cytobacillus sp.]|nr:cytochrome c oxidase subunit 2A [Cytobacillus sp.]